MKREGFFVSRLACLLLLWLLPVLALAEGPEDPADPVQLRIDAIQDYRHLERLGDEARAGGDLETARRYYLATLHAMEIHKYLPYRQVLEDALLLERLEDFEQAAERYRESMDEDLLYTILVLRIISEHPQREPLVQEALARVQSVVDTARSGGKGQIYTTKSGKPRYLEPITQDELLRRARAGETIRYCYLELLDLNLVPDEQMPALINMNRCVLGGIKASGRHIPKLAFKGFVLGDVQLGKQWTGEKNKSKTLPPSTLGAVSFRESVILGEANFAGLEVEVEGSFPMVVFEGLADFKAAIFRGLADWRFASFGAGANFKDARLHKSVYFGGSRYRADTVFTGLYAERFVYFNSTIFEGAASFDKCEWLKGATFEDSNFRGPVSLATSRIRGRLNMSRAIFRDTLSVKEVHTQGLDMVGTTFRENASFIDARFDGKVRFSLDDVTRATHLQDPTPLLPLYRDYQGDEDADEPLSTGNSYGVDHVDDSIARVEKDISFANTVFTGYAVFERVTFGTEGKRHLAQFYNTQFLGESHFERTTWHSAADFTTIFGNELAFNEALFNDTLILDDANVTGRVTLTDARFAPGADWSWYGAEIRTLQVALDQVADEHDRHRLFYEKCALDSEPGWQDDLRIQRMLLGEELDEEQLRIACYAQTVDEFVGLKDSFGDRAMTTAEDDAYWWARHHETMQRLRFGGLWDKVAAVFNIVLFEWTFGWGVRLANLGFASVFITALFALIYRVWCPDTVLAYHGGNYKVRDVSFAGLFFVSLQSLIAINTGWDFGEDDHRFRYLNTVETLIGFIILTFFVGAYTRMILA